MDENGDINEIISVGRDITEQKNREEALIKSESSLREGQEIAKFGNWEMDVSSKWIAWSDENFRIFGIDRPHEGGLSFDDFMKFVHPDDRALIFELWERDLPPRDVRN